MKDFLTLAKERWSVRSFKQEKVPDELIDKLVEAALAAPTACNGQAFHVFAIKSEEALERFRRCTPCHFDAPLAFLICADANAEFSRSFDGKKSGNIDASIVTTHLILEAADLGLGSTWVMYFIPEAVREEFALPEQLEPVALLPVGFPADDAKPSPLHSKCKPFDELISTL